VARRRAEQLHLERAPRPDADPDPRRGAIAPPRAGDDARRVDQVPLLAPDALRQLRRRADGGELRARRAARLLVPPDQRARLAGLAGRVLGAAVSDPRPAPAGPVALLPERDESSPPPAGHRRRDRAGAGPEPLARSRSGAALPNCWRIARRRTSRAARRD